MVELMTLGSWGFLGDLQVCKWMVDTKLRKWNKSGVGKEKQVQF